MEKKNQATILFDRIEYVVG